jgi:predicted neutral ceramidase superfamily lipid hydrolase
VVSFPFISISGVFSQQSHIHTTLCLLSRRRSRRGRISAVALISALRRLDSGLLAIVTVVGVECVASVLRLLLLAVRGRRSVALVVTALVVTLVMATLVTVVVHLVVVVVLSPGLASHPAGAVDGLSATALATAREATTHEKEDEEKDNDAC